MKRKKERTIDREREREGGKVREAKGREGGEWKWRKVRKRLGDGKGVWQGKYGAAMAPDLSLLELARGPAAPPDGPLQA